MRILVIDDDARLATAVQRSLTGHDVSIETDPSCAIARVETADVDGQPFDVVVCDFKMPQMSGLDVLAGLRSTREPPMLILMSGYDDVVEAAFIADRILIKPFRTSEILEAIERIKTQRSRTTTRRLRRTPSATAEVRFNVR